MRPGLKLLSDDLIANVVAEARDILSTLGVEIHNPAVPTLLAEHGARPGTGMRASCSPATSSTGP